MKLLLQHHTRLFSWDQEQPCSFPTHLPPSVLLAGSSSPSFLQDNLKLCFKWESYSAWHFNKIECDFSTRGFFGVTTSFVASDWSQKNTLIRRERDYYIKFSPSTSSVQINLRSNNHVFFFFLLYIQTFEVKDGGVWNRYLPGLNFFYLEIFFLSWNILYLETFFLVRSKAKGSRKKKIHQKNPQKKKVTGENPC